VMEGSECFRTPDCQQVGLTLPVAEYDHSDGCSVTGGYVYRGCALPSVRGTYFYSDYCTGFISAVPADDPTAEPTPLLRDVGNVVGQHVGRVRDLDAALAAVVDRHAVVADAEGGAAGDDALAGCTSGHVVVLDGDRGEPLKVQLIDEKTAGQPEVSCYTIKDKETFVDFCVGPHVPTTGKLKAFKLLSIAGAYWKGDEHKKQLQRIYGTAWFTPKDQDAYLKQIEEAKKRDHRKLGKELENRKLSSRVFESANEAKRHLESRG